MIEPLRLAFEVACPASHAFETWTERTSMWWPPAHTVTHDPKAIVVFEPHVNGRIFERSSSGREVDWGRITSWDPPRRLVYQWHIATDPESATEVEIAFVDLGDRTRVEIEHRGWERLGDRGRGWREMNQAGWDGVLGPYAEACTRVSRAI